MDFKEFQHYLIDNDMQNDMVLLGQKSNPYPYFKQADLVAVLSYYEGLCGVVNESKILEKPLVATEFSGIKEQIENTVNGFIFENDFESIVEGMKKVLDSTSNLQATAINGMPNEIINDNYKVEQLTALF
jgi:glycosyltransferase involved in cell wall biosynthesis